MKTFKILGSGCKNCNKTAELIETSAQQMAVEITIEKVTDIADIMAYGVMSTPGVVLDEKVVHAGGIPTKDAISTWLNA